MDVKFTLYKGFLIAEHSETDFKAYRNRSYYAQDITTYNASSRGSIDNHIDDASDIGDFSEEEYNKVMQLLGRKEPIVVGFYSDNIMDRVRQHIGLEPGDTSRDEEINRMSRDAVFDHVLEWEGIIGYGSQISNWIKSIYYGVMPGS